MPGGSDQETALARVYAAAMLQLAESLGEADWLLEELTDFAARLEVDPELDTFLTSPTIDAAARRTAFEKLLRGKYSDLFVDSLQVINRKGRLGLIRGLARTYHLLLEELRGRVEVHVRTAAPLTDRHRAELKEVAAKQTGKQPDLVETVDESLIGGLIMQIGDQRFDTSVATRLKRLAGALLDRASREIHSGRTYLGQPT